MVGLKVTDLMDTVFYDTAHFDVQLHFNGGYEALDKIAINNAQDLIPFTFVKGELTTPEYTVEAYVTPAQDKLLKALYSATMHPKYVDQRYPIEIAWGYIKNGDSSQMDGQFSNLAKCYLSEYTPPSDIDYSDAKIFSVSLVLRVI